MGAEATGNQALGARIRQMRHDQGLTLAVLARRAEISLPYLSEIERGRRLPSLEVLARVSAALSTSVVEVLRGIDAFDPE